MTLHPFMSEPFMSDENHTNEGQSWRVSPFVAFRRSNFSEGFVELKKCRLYRSVQLKVRRSGYPLAFDNWRLSLAANHAARFSLTSVGGLRLPR